MSTGYLPFGKPSFGEDEINAVSRVMRSGWVGMGLETIAFEEELAAFFGAPHVVTVNSCTSALMLSLLVSEVKPGDEVICPSLTWCSSANAAIYCGATPVFCDVDPKTLCITEDLVKNKITAKTKAIVVVHFGGLAIDIKRLRADIPDHIKIIEDAAHALGSKYHDNTPVGSSGNLTCFSFYANKNLSTGEGGAISLSDAEIADRLRSLRQHGLVADAWKRFSQPKSMLSADILELGYKMNYTDLQASIGRVQLKRQREFHEIRLSIANVYYENLTGREHDMEFQSDILSDGHARHLFVIKLPLEKLRINRNEFILALRDRQIGATIHYMPLHLIKLYKEINNQPSLLNTEGICERILTLPISASMSVEQAKYVVTQFNLLMAEYLK